MESELLLFPSTVSVNFDESSFVYFVSQFTDQSTMNLTNVELSFGIENLELRYR